MAKSLREAGMDGSIGGADGALDNPLMESTIGLYKTLLIELDPAHWWASATKSNARPRTG